MNNCCSPSGEFCTRLLKEKRLKSILLTDISGCFNSLRNGALSFFADHLPFLYSVHSSLTSTVLSPRGIASPSAGRVIFFSCCLRLKVAQKTYSRRFQITGIRWSPWISASTFSHGVHEELICLR